VPVVWIALAVAVFLPVGIVGAEKDKRRVSIY
jgi:hypothetical protein